jgi:hypothetical protein
VLFLKIILKKVKIKKLSLVHNRREHLLDGL